MGVIAEGILRGCQGLFTPVSLGYPLSVFNKNSTLKPLLVPWYKSYTSIGPFLVPWHKLYTTMGLVPVPLVPTCDKKWVYKAVKTFPTRLLGLLEERNKIWRYGRQIRFRNNSLGK